MIEGGSGSESREDGGKECRERRVRKHAVEIGEVMVGCQVVDIVVIPETAYSSESQLELGRRGAEPSKTP